MRNHLLVGSRSAHLGCQGFGVLPRIVIPSVSTLNQRPVIPCDEFVDHSRVDDFVLCDHFENHRIHVDVVLMAFFKIPLSVARYKQRVQRLMVILKVVEVFFFVESCRFVLKSLAMLTIL